MLRLPGTRLAVEAAIARDEARKREDEEREVRNTLISALDAKRAEIESEIRIHDRVMGQFCLILALFVGALPWVVTLMILKDSPVANNSYSKALALGNLLLGTSLSAAVGLILPKRLRPNGKLAELQAINAKLAKLDCY